MKRFKPLWILFVLILPVLFLQAGDIHDAARQGDLDKVKELVSKNPASVNETTARGMTPLHSACAGRHFEIVEYLITKGADVNALNDSHNSPLQYAAAYNQTKIVKLLLDKGARIDQQDREGDTALHNAGIYGAVDVVKQLIEGGADIHLKNSYGRTPFVLTARERGNVAAATLLLDAGSDINSVDKYGDTGLTLAAWRGFNEFVDLLLDRGVKIPPGIEARGDLLYYSIGKRLVRLLNTLVDAGVDLKMALSMRPSLINDAARGGSVEIIEKLTKSGFDLTFSDNNGWTPLHCAAELNRQDAVQYLIKKSVDTNARTKMGQTAYNVALEENSPESAELLKASGAETESPRFPKLKGKYLGQTPPGKIPEIFAPGIVEAHYQLHSSVAFSPDGKTAFWEISLPPRETGYGSGRMLGTAVKNGNWTYPEVPSFKGGDVPFFSHDGKILYFISRDPIPGQTGRKENIWYAERTKDGWSEAKPLDPAVNAVPMHWQFSLDKKGTLYFGDGQGRIMVSKKTGEGYENPVDFRERFGNSSVRGGSPYIAPDGDYLIFNREEDLHITFSKSDGTWTEALDMGSDINTDGFENCPLISPCGKYLFFRSSRAGQHGIHWVAIEERLEELRKQALGK
ncbi:ankyrin repeat domain-containing protein [bacterium]